MGEFERSRFVAAFAVMRASVAVVALFSCTACDNLLGIDEPHDRPDGGSMAGNAGAGSSPIDGGGAGGEAGSEAAGAAGDDHPSDSLLIVGDDATLCPGADVTLSLTAKGGTAPYTWKLLGADPAFALHQPGATRDKISITGTPSTASEVQVSVTDSSPTPQEFHRTFTVTVADAPVIDTVTIPSVCPGEIYSAPLKAHGGDKTKYDWSSTTLPASTGLSIKDGVLQGKFLGAPNDATHIDFRVRLKDGGACPDSVVDLSMAVETATSLQCTGVGIVGREDNRPPPAVCLNAPYEKQLAVRRGKGPFTLRATALPGGLHFDPDTLNISGTAASGGALTVQVYDQGYGRTIERSMALGTRDKCWFAYVSKESGAQRLHLFDPLLEARKTLPIKPAAGDVVTDFKFSPDGKWLAYRVGLANGPAKLALLKIDTWVEDRLNLVGDGANVTHYAWSADSSTLAVSYSTASGVQLTATRVATAQAGPLGIVFQILSPIAASVDSDPIWFDNNHLAFFKQVTESSLYPSTTSLDSMAAAFEPITTRLTTLSLPGTPMRAAAKGVFVVPHVDDGFIQYYGSDGSKVVLHDAVISPSGSYTARAQDQALFLFRARDDSYFGDPYDQLQGCDTVLAWAAGKERIACARQVANADDQLLMFDVKSDDTLNLFSNVNLMTPFPNVVHDGRRRLFSPSGKYFAFAADLFLTVVDLQGASDDAKFSVSLPSTGLGANSAFAEISFSPDERLMLLHRGTGLAFVDLTRQASGQVQLTPVTMADSVACSEDFQDTDVGWCGVERPNAPFAWGPGSDTAMFQAADQSLHFFDFSNYSLGIYRPVPVNDQCGADCVVAGQFAFQP